jgi:hypothetical protein
MGKGQGSFCGRARLRAFFAGLMLALAVPGIAFAATASFSGVAPKAGSSSTVTRPPIAISVYDKYGVRGTSSYTMTVNDVKVRPSIKYTHRGDYRRFKLSYTVTSDLAVGVQKVYVKVHDGKHKTSTYTWTFTVTAPVPPAPADMPVTIAANSCATCHGGYPAAHPMTDCPACHGASAPVGGPTYQPSDVSAHTLACSLESPCHGGGGNFPHTLSSDCAACHNSSYPAIPQSHGAATVADHTSTSTFCTQSGCHSASLTIEHYKYSIAGSKLSCATCHQSTDAGVVAAIAGGSTACESCHVFSASSHPGTTTVHAKPTFACTEAGCHDADLAGIHKGRCAACHAPDKTASAVCSSCHPADPHTGLATIHTAAAIDCTASDCHGTNALSIHTAPGGPGCAACHAPTSIKTLVCATCHPGAVSAIHARGTTPHTVSGDCAIPGCHVDDAAGAANVATIHAPGPNCSACHATGKVPSTTCATCHGDGTFHDGVAALHVLPAEDANCAVSGCHSADVSLIHGERGIGCIACHAPGKTPSTVCTDCHPTPHTDLTAAHTAPEAACFSSACHATNVLVIHKGKCVDCHAPGRVPSTDCITCHPTAHAGQSASHTLPSSNCSGTGCHEGSAAAVHKDVCTRCHFQSYPASVTCADCHSTVDHITLHQVADRTDDCRNCHAGTNLTIIHKTCATCHASRDAKVAAAIDGHDTLCSACHVGHDLPAPHASGLGSMTATITIDSVDYAGRACADCHRSADLRTLHADNCAACHSTTLKVDTTLGGTWNKGCVQGDCHGGASTVPMHAGVETAHIADATGALCGVSGCHTGGSNVAAIHAAVTGRTDDGCGICHDGVRVSKPTLVCATANCHPNGPPASHDSHPSPTTSAEITIASVSYGVHQCSECHASTDLQVAHGENGTNNSCATCHPTPANSATKGVFTCAQGNCHAGTSTIPMHGSIEISHAASAAADCTVPGCHTGGTNVAAIHSAVPGRTDSGCGICHDGVRVSKPTLVCATANCHPNGPPASHNSHPSPTTSAEITIASVSYGVHQCSECHASTDLQVAHGENGTNNSCATCHPTPANSATKGVFTCAQGNCHAGTSTIPMHGSIEISHAASAAADCTVPGCHTGGTNVAAIHSAVPGRTDSGCGICHDGVRVSKPTLVCATANCHPNGPPASHDSHPATVTTGTITIAGVGTQVHECSECHASTDLQVAHGEDGTNNSCATCHPTPANSAAKGVFTCAQGNCHAGTSPIPMHGSVETSHVAAAAAGCGVSGCHTGGTNVAAIHSAVTGRTDSGCGICHDGVRVSTPTLVCATANCHPDGPPASHNSHPATVTTGTITIAGVGTQVHECSECHASTDLQVAHGEDGTNNSCATCHPDPASSATKGDFSCVQGDCHAGTSPAPMHGDVEVAHAAGAAATACGVSGCHTGDSDAAAIHAAVTGRTDSGCGICHDGVRVSKPTLVCATANCHPDGPPASHASHPAPTTSGTITILGTDYPNQTCSTCHGVMDLQTVHGEDGTQNSCATCHPTPANSATKGVFTCAQGNCHAGTSPIPMHGSLDTSHTTPAAAQTSCGTQGTSACHGTLSNSVAKIHSAEGCAACHGAGKTPSLNCTSSSCHSNVPHDLPAAHAATMTSAVFTVGGVSGGAIACSVCHASTDLRTVHSTNGCATCHTSSTKVDTVYFSGSSWNKSCVQGGCHAVGSTKPYHGTSVPGHVVDATGCNVSGCHSTNVAEVHGRTGCAACHGAGKTPSLVCADCHGGSGPSTLTVTGIASHNAVHNYCNDCHSTSEHSGWVTNPITDQACTNCHTGTPGSTTALRVGHYQHGCDEFNCHY